MNGEYIKRMDEGRFHEMALPYYKSAGLPEGMDLQKVSQLLKGRVEVLNEIPEMVDFLVNLADYDIELYVHKRSKSTLESSYENLVKAYKVLETLDDWSEDSIKKVLFDLVEELAAKLNFVLWPVRIAASGKQITPGGGIEILYLLGKEESLRRLQVGIDKLKGAL
jgi:glutamyl-tRNA synthetase